MIYLLQHGQSHPNLDNQIKCRELSGDLTTIGYNQAHQAGLWLRDKAIDAVIASPFERTRRTAEIIGKVLDLAPQVDPDLSEIHCGDLENRDDKDGWLTWKAIFDRWIAGEADARFPGGESFQQAYQRYSRALLYARDASQSVIVTHGGITRSVLPYLCVNFAALQRVDMPSETGFIVLEPYDDSRYICHAWNLVEHLG